MIKPASCYSDLEFVYLARFGFERELSWPIGKFCF
jgi:hypothetical protein